MSKHTRLVVTILFAVIIVLAFAITRFYVGTSGSSSKSGDQGAVERYLGQPDSAGNRIFEDSSGLCGLADSSGRVMVSPEWVELSFAGSSRCIASRRVGGRILTGCIDYEGNAVVPFIYSSIEKKNVSGQDFFIARADSDGSCVIYGCDFSTLLGGAWDSAEIDGSSLILTDSGDSFVYSCGAEGFTLSSASLTGEALTVPYSLDIAEGSIPKGLSPAKLRRIVTVTGVWLDFAYTGSEEFYSAVPPSNWIGFAKLFPDDKQITSRKLLSITGVTLAAAEPENGAPCYELSLNTDTQIDYKDSSGKDKTLRGAYTAKVKFRGAYDSSFEAVSGTFNAEHPAYPEDTAQPPDIPPKTEDT